MLARVDRQRRAPHCPSERDCVLQDLDALEIGDRGGHADREARKSRFETCGVLAGDGRAIHPSILESQGQRLAEFGPRRRRFSLRLVAKGQRDERSAARIELLAFDELRASLRVLSCGHELLRVLKQDLRRRDLLRRRRLSEGRAEQEQPGEGHRDRAPHGPTYEPAISDAPSRSSRNRSHACSHSLRVKTCGARARRSLFGQGFSADLADDRARRRSRECSARR